MEVGIRRLQRSAYDATQGLSTAVDAFGELGVSVRGADGQLKSTEQLFMESAATLAKMENNTKKAALATVIFGRAGTKLLPMLKNGADGLVEVMEEARRLGIVMSTEDATAAAELTDAWTRLTSVLKMAVARIGGALAPRLTELAAQITKIVRPVIDWIQQNAELIVSVAKIAAVVVAAGAGLILLGGLLSGVGIVFGTLASVAAGVGTAIATIGTVIGAILSPVGLVAAAVASLAGYFLYASGAGEQALSWLGRQFTALKERALAAWQGIGDALAGGNIALAAKILWLTLKVEWQKGIHWLTTKWVAFKETLMAVWTEAVFGTAKILASAWAGIQTAWAETVAFMSKVWTIFTSGLVTGWQTAQNWISKKFVALMAMFDSTIDVEASQKILDEDFQKEQRQREARTQGQLAQIETTRQARQKAIDEEQRGTLGELDREKDARHAARQKQYDADLAASEDAVAQARKDWQAALDEAAKGRAAIADETAPGPMKKLGELEGLDLEGLGQRAASVQGTFNAAAARGLESGGPAERTARGVEQVARNTGELVKEAKLGGLVFG